MATNTATGSEPFSHLDKLIVQFSAELVGTPGGTPRTSAANSPSIRDKAPRSRVSSNYTTRDSPSVQRKSTLGSRPSSSRTGADIEPTMPSATSTPQPQLEEAPQDLDSLMANIAAFKTGLQSQDESQSPGITFDTSQPGAESSGPPFVSPPISPRSRRRATSVGKRQTKGANTAAAETCPFCDEVIGGYFSVKALGRHWHADHLRCNICDKVLGTGTFFHKELNLFCGDCWTDHFSPRCEFCNEAILESCIEALGKNWHPEHFFCSQCGKKIGNGEPFMEHQDKAYCEEDYFALFSPLCMKCEKAITTEFVEALGRKWHPNCFSCRTCDKTLSNGTFFELHGHGYCEAHYHEAKGSICAGCSKPIAGRCLNVMGKKYHTEHFVCTFCMTGLEKAAFKEGAGEKPYCVPCHTRLFG